MGSYSNADEVGSAFGSALNNTGGGVLRAKAGTEAIVEGDLVSLCSATKSELYPVQSMDYALVSDAGGTPIPETDVAGPDNGNTDIPRSRALINPESGDILIADSYLSGRAGCKVWRFSAGGDLLSELVLDNYNASGVWPAIKYLSNGNVLCFWYYYGGTYALNFAVLDPLLNVVVSATQIATASTNPSPNPDIIALSGGGFALAWAHANVGSYFAIYDNDGAEVYAPTLISGAPTNNSGNANGPKFTLAELSNGNILVAINDRNTTPDVLRFVIYSPTGDEVVAYQPIAGSGNSSDIYPLVSVLDGFFIIANALFAFVMNNAGAVQGAAFPVDSTYFFVNDGTDFLSFHRESSALVMTRIPITGTDLVESPMPTTIGGNVVGVIHERGRFIAFTGGGLAYVVRLNENDLPELEGTPTIMSSTAAVFGGLPDYCALLVATGKIQVVKYLDASIFGVALEANAANNPGVLLAVNTGPAHSPVNEINGASGTTFDHRTAAITANKGVLYEDSVILEGIV